jgi:Uma2 family endonuclease
MAEQVASHGGGRVLVGDVGFVLELPHDRDRVRAPDVAFVATARLPDGRLPEGFIRCAPDLAVEVLSPSDNPVDVQQKVRDYLSAGARLVWVVAPAARSATVHRADGSARLLREDDRLDGEDTLPGLLIPLSELFD